MWNTQHSGKEAFTCTNDKGYKIGNLNNHTYQAHQLIWIIMTGENPPELIDHKDRNRSNNKWTNLRNANGRINRLNAEISSNNTSGFNGITREGSRWRVRLGQKQIGSFASIEDAISARNIADSITASELFADQKG